MDSLRLYTTGTHRWEIVAELKIVAARSKEEAIPLLMNVLQVDREEASKVADNYWVTPREVSLS